jgi:cytochrome c oxidase cbb3-type subunit 3
MVLGFLRSKELQLFSTVVLATSICLPAALVIAKTSPAGGQTNAAALFSKNCARCHGRDGRASGLKAKATGARNLTDAKWQDRVSDERIFNSINNGKGKMPAYGKKLSEAEIDALVSYVRTLKK